MEQQRDETFCTSAKDCLRWSVKFFAALAVGIFVLILIQSASWGNNTSIVGTRIGYLLLAMIAICPLFGLLVFFFGWLGRVTVSESGLRAPLYSGKRAFLAWSDISRAAAGTLSGWPCTLVYGRDCRQPVYLMVIGSEKSKMVACIESRLGNRNPLLEHLRLTDT